MGNTASVQTEASDSAQQPATTAPAPETKPKKKICCVCPDTKKLRDDCIVQNGEDACGKFIEAHLQCLRAEGFSIWRVAPSWQLHTCFCSNLILIMNSMMNKNFW
ncbi:unnamed protein product [Miscanthus lutarioriparius]|uniref:Cytochrome c oxidase copper chaperone n=1 Tax=Miscanthus lutarioriparius TaxID=422564 RepID=A0A811NPV6_9POAL|nr:unnamed protein product [Miscanthus lutarioriparius]